MEDFYEELRILMNGAVRNGMRIILAGDFNTEIGKGDRGIALQNLLTGYGLRIFNELDHVDIERIWTHKSSVGLLRQIDFIIGNVNFEVKDSFVSKTLDLGSDHRAVVAEVSIKERPSPRYSRTSGLKSWRPNIEYMDKVRDDLMKIGSLDGLAKKLVMIADNEKNR